MIKIFKNVKNKDSNQFFNLNIEFCEDYFVLKIFEQNTAWETNISCHDVEDSAAQFSLSKEEYFSKLKNYLLDTPKTVEFKFTKGDFFCYSKSQNGINLKYFSCKLCQIEFNLNQLLQTYSLECERFRQQNENIIKEMDQLKQDKVNLENKLKELVVRKSQDEEELYSNFVLVLNEKKRKIQHLNQTLQAFKAGRAVLNSQVQLKAKGKKDVKKEIKNEVSESDSENDEYATDEEKPVNNLKDNEKTLPSTLKNKLDLYLDDEDSSISYNLPKRTKANLKNEFIKVIPSTSKKQEEEQPEENNMEIEEDSPKISFDTQDLLDCI